MVGLATYVEAFAGRGNVLHISSVAGVSNTGHLYLLPAFDGGSRVELSMDVYLNSLDRGFFVELASDFGPSLDKYGCATDGDSTVWSLAGFSYQPGVYKDPLPELRGWVSTVGKSRTWYDGDYLATPMSLEANRWYSLRLVHTLDQFSLYVDDALAFSMPSSYWGFPREEVWLFRFGDGGSEGYYTCDALFDNVKLTLVQDEYTMGDLNEDGVIDLLDVRICFQIAQGSVDPTPFQMQQGDIDADGDVDMDDTTLLAQYVIGMRGTLP